MLNKTFTIKGKKFSVGQAFERSTSTFLNEARLFLFMSRVQDLYSQGKTFENAPKEFETAARAINEFTGHGKVAAPIQKASAILNPIIWSTKMFASTLNVLGLGDIVRPVALIHALGKKMKLTESEYKGSKGFYTSLTPEQGKFAAKELSRFIMGGAMVMLTAKVISMMKGEDDDAVQIDLDPRSSGFGSIITENKIISVYGRYGSAIRTIVQVFSGVKVKDGKEKILGEGYNPQTSLDVLYSSFVRGKMTPSAGVISDFILNNRKNYYTGEKMTPSNIASQLFVPMSIQDVLKDMDRDGTLLGVIETLAKGYGAPIRDKRDFEKKPEDILEKAKIKKTNIDKDKIKNYKTGKMATDEEIDLYVNKYNEFIDKKINSMKSNGVVTIQNGVPVTKPYGEASEEQIEKEIESYKRDLSTSLKQRIFGMQPRREKALQTAESKRLNIYRHKQENKQGILLKR